MKKTYKKPAINEKASEDFQLLLKIGEWASKSKLPDFKTDGEAQLAEFYKDSHLHGVYPPSHIKETTLKKGGVAVNELRPQPLDAKPGDTIVVQPLNKGKE